MDRSVWILNKATASNATDPTIGLESAVHMLSRHAAGNAFTVEVITAKPARNNSTKTTGVMGATSLGTTMSTDSVTETMEVKVQTQRPRLKELLDQAKPYLLLPTSLP